MLIQQTLICRGRFDGCDDLPNICDAPLGTGEIDPILTEPVSRFLFSLKETSFRYSLELLRIIMIVGSLFWDIGMLSQPSVHIIRQKQMIKNTGNKFLILAPHVLSLDEYNCFFIGV